MSIGGYKNVWAGVCQGAGSDPVSRSTEVYGCPTQEKQARVTIQQLKSMVKRSWGVAWGFDHSLKNRDPAKAAPAVGEAEEYDEGTVL